MRSFLLLAPIFSSILALAQGPSFNNVQRTTGSVGVTAGQTARLTILYPTVPAPLLLIQCSATLSIFDDKRNALKSTSVSQIAPGTLVSLDLNADTDLAGAARTQIYGLSFTPGCQLVTTLEIIDNITQKTVVVIGSRQTYPFVSTARAMEASQSAESPGR